MCDNLVGTLQESSEVRQTDPSQFPDLCVVLASDGIWDNWEYDDVTKFVMNPVNAYGCEDVMGVDRATQISRALIKANGEHARRNFGDQADNATGVVLFIHPKVLPL